MLAVVVAGALAALAAPQTAPAHAFLERSEPSDGAVLRDPPRIIRLWFSEDVVARFSRVELLGDEGTPVGLRAVDAGTGARGLITFAAPALGRGVYSIRWTVLSEEDSHLRKGTLVFRVGAGARPAPAGGRDESPLSTLEVALRWLDLLLLATLGGALAVGGLVFARVEVRTGGELADAARRARRRTVSLAALAAGLSLVLGLGLLAWQTAVLARNLPGGTGLAGLGWELLSDSRWGALWLAREAVLLLLVALLATRWAADGALLPLAPAAALAVAVLAVHALGGHAASSGAVLAVPVATLHLAAATLWLGGLLALAAGLWPELRRARAGIPGLARTSLREFGGLAAVSVGVLVATGLYYAGQQVATLDALAATRYGQALTGKTALVLAVGSVGLTSAVLLHPRWIAPLARLLRRPAGWTPVAATRWRFLLVAEGALGLVVVAAAALLAASAPARGTAFDPPPEASPGFRSQPVDDLLVTLSVKPGLPGPNVFEVVAASTRRPPPAEIDRVSLRLTDARGATVSARMGRVEPARYRAAGEYLGTPGAWRLAVVVERGRLGPSVADFDWSVPGAASAGAADLFGRPLEPALTRASVAVFLLLALTACWLAARRALAGRPLLPERGARREA
jgi:copper transport protein